MGSRGVLLFPDRHVTLDRAHQFLQIWQLFAEFEEIGSLKVDVVPCHGGGLLDDLQARGVPLVFKAGQELAEDAGVEVNDGIGDQARAFIPQHDLFVRTAPELIPVDATHSAPQLVIGLTPIQSSLDEFAQTDIINVSQQVIGVLEIFRPKKTKSSEGLASPGLQRGITFARVTIPARLE